MTVGQQRVFSALLQQHGVPTPEYEVRFHPTRRWRFDARWKSASGQGGLGLEVDGGLFLPGGGRHNRGATMRKDFEKFNQAACLGYRILRVLPEQLLTMATVEMVRRALGCDGACA